MITFVGIALLFVLFACALGMFFLNKGRSKMDKTGRQSPDETGTSGANIERAVGRDD